MPKKKEDKEILELAHRLREAIKTCHLSFKEAAEKARLPEGTLRIWVQAQAVPRLDQFAALVRSLNVNPLYIITGQGSPILIKKKLPFLPKMKKSSRKTTKHS